MGWRQTSTRSHRQEHFCPLGSYSPRQERAILPSSSVARTAHADPDPFAPRQIGYQDHITNNLTTLSTNNVEKIDGTFGGLLYVPHVTAVPACDTQQYDFIPQNVTRREQLPPSNFNIIAIAPWFSADCTQAYLNAAHGSVRAFIFYRPDNSTDQPQDADSPVWNLDDNGDWRKKNRFPIFAIPGSEGAKLITQLSLYSGRADQVPNAQQISQRFGPSPNDYVRIWTDVTMTNSPNAPAVWAFVLIVIGALLLIITAVSLTMHLVQRRNRKSLQRRVQSGEVDLEAMGIKRLTVPVSQVEQFPIFTYNAHPDLFDDHQQAPSTPSKLKDKSRKRRQKAAHNNLVTELVSSGTAAARSIRSKRSGMLGIADSTATNFQPNCQICLAGFEHDATIIRELPCGHIFHPACIDEFLIDISSLCPVCKHCMLPPGYCPRITNGMVRRERAVRRLREKVDLDDCSSLESGESRLKEWKRRLFSSTSSPSSPASPPLAAVVTSSIPLEKLAPVRADAGANGKTTTTTTTLLGSSRSKDGAPLPDGIARTTQSSDAAVPSETMRPRRSQSRALRPNPTHADEDKEPREEELVRQFSPSSFARERMRQIAADTAPFDDPDRHRPRWRRVIAKAFPGFT